MRNRSFAPVLVLVLCVLGCRFFSGSGGKEVVYAPTEVGTPLGDKVTKDIGSTGGTLSSPDGKLTLTVPPNALTETVAFSIQPITNKAANGLGIAYRLGPDGMKFVTPLQLGFRYDDTDLEGTVPEAVSMAYQDQKGAWHSQNSGTLDQSARTLTIPVIHFTDFASLARLRLIPARATVRVGKAQIVQLLVCAQPGLVDRLLSRTVSCEDQGQQPPHGDQTWSLEGPGSIQESAYSQRQGMMFVTYIAPARKPNPNVAKVKLKAKFYTWHPNTGESTVIEKTFESHTTIVDSGYKATGSWGGLTWSGTVCDLQKPFNIVGKARLLTFIFKFSPSADGTSGTTAVGGGGYGVTLHDGNGTYTVSGIDAEQPTITLTMESFKGTYPGVGTAEGSGTRIIQLVPLDTEECGGLTN